MSIKTKKLFLTRKNRVRFKLKKKSSTKIRLSIFRSNKYIYAQLIDDNKSATIASASTIEKTLDIDTKNRSNIKSAYALGKLIAQRGLASNVKEVVFDRGGYLYHGCVKALADAAREGGLTF